MHNWRYLFVQKTSLKANVIWVLHLNSFEPFEIYLELLGKRYKYKRPSPSDSIWARVNWVHNFCTHFTLKLNVLQQNWHSRNPSKNWNFARESSWKPTRPSSSSHFAICQRMEKNEAPICRQCLFMMTSLGLEMVKIGFSDPDLVRKHLNGL